ncbi:NAD(P)H-hydrate epimerase [uncultured Limosilactobacillus sp.]|uniref:NAD(P)H-hydrate epimerase n=1 Tax=uncultured Limosilactobacillus sp. TaxID=2837629 RepID=UPI0025EBE368|nr:NAD(P)H-hydrate epimerase [uncultured Limosilactobacillus sp.]
MIVMTKTVTAQEMQMADQFTINTIGIPGMVLMERAALALRDIIQVQFTHQLSQVVVVAGSGNNGGDGLALARLLHLQKVPIEILNVGNPDHASQQHQDQDHICQYYQIPQTRDIKILNQASLIIDAIFGVGLDRPITGNYLTVINAINQATAPVLTVDVPSGMNTDTGEIMGAAVQANMTVTMAFNKQGLTTASGQQLAGEVVIADDIGIY